MPHDINTVYVYIKFMLTKMDQCSKYVTEGDTKRVCYTKLNRLQLNGTSRIVRRHCNNGIPPERSLGAYSKYDYKKDDYIRPPHTAISFKKHI